MKFNYIKILKFLVRAFSAFIFFIAVLQFQDGYNRYGAISVTLGVISLYLSKEK